MYRFFVEKEQIGDGEIRITGSDVNHIKNVLRLKIGEKLTVSDGSNVAYFGEVAEYLPDEVLIRVNEVQEGKHELPSRITLFQGLPKGDKMDLIVQKCVELGVAEIIPVKMERCIVKLDSKKETNRLKRWNAISESAAKQAKRMFIPEVCPCVSFEEALEVQKSFDIRLLPYELAEGMEGSRKILSKIPKGSSISILIGPEGGITKEEVTKAMDIGMIPITLGRRILRTETAGMALMAILSYLLDD